LGVLLLNGVLPVGRDDKFAFGLFKSACEGDNAGGCHNLGFAFHDARGTTRDFGRAAQAYRKACELYWSASCVNLASMTENAEGVARDVNAAGHLYEKACQLGNQTGCKELDRFKRVPISQGAP
jgi:TPR repeat protein